MSAVWSGRRILRITPLLILCGLLATMPLPSMRTAATVFVAVCVQALPFVVLGSLVSGAIAAFVPAGLLRRALPRSELAAVGVAGLAGMLLPGCECASVPVARRLMRQGVPVPVALTFLLAAPAINPVVLVATAVAFPTMPLLVLARFLSSLVTAIVTGWLWSRWGRADWVATQAMASESDGFVATVRTDLIEAGGFLVMGALATAALNVAVPTSWFGAVGGHPAVSVLVFAGLAVLLAVCSEADAFVAASFTSLPLLPRLVFLVVGPAVDVKLMAMYGGAFGRAFVTRFAPLALIIAVCSAVLIGIPLLGGYR